MRSCSGTRMKSWRRRAVHLGRLFVSLKANDGGHGTPSGIDDIATAAKARTLYAIVIDGGRLRTYRVVAKVLAWQG